MLHNGQMDRVGLEVPATLLHTHVDMGGRMLGAGVPLPSES